MTILEMLKDTYEKLNNVGRPSTYVMTQKEFEMAELYNLITYSDGKIYCAHLGEVVVMRKLEYLELNNVDVNEVERRLNETL
jgi:hypothetical protein